MAIAANEIVPYYAANRSKTDPAANGGRPANVPVPNSVEGNVWPSLTTAQRTAGQTICEKVFFKNRNAANESGDSPWLALGSPNPSGDHEWIVAADQDNLQSALTGSERRYTASKLATDATAGSNTLVLTLDDAGLANAYQDGDSVIIYSGRNSMWADGGHQERATISGAPQASGTQLTLTLAAVLTHSHPAATGVCCSLCTSVTPFAPRIDNVSQSGTGSYDLAGHPIELGNLGAVRQRWTLTYNGTGQATLSGDTMGSLDDGHRVRTGHALLSSRQLRQQPSTRHHMDRRHHRRVRRLLPGAAALWTGAATRGHPCVAKSLRKAP